MKHLLEVRSLISGGRWREDIRVKDWVGKVVADVLDLNLGEPSHREKAKGCLEITNGALKVELGPDNNRKERPFLTVGASADE